MSSYGTYILKSFSKVSCSFLWLKFIALKTCFILRYIDIIPEIKAETKKDLVDLQKSGIMNATNIEPAKKKEASFIIIPAKESVQPKPKPGLSLSAPLCSSNIYLPVRPIQEKMPVYFFM